jgi:hypothetical protein
MMQARYAPASPPNTTPTLAASFLGDDDEYYDQAAENVRKGGETPPTPRTPSEFESPRSELGFFEHFADGGQDTPCTPRSDNEAAGIKTPPEEEYDSDDHRVVDLSYHPNEEAHGRHTRKSPGSRRKSTAGTMGWTAEVDALITPGGTRVGTRANTGWASHSGYDDMHDLGDISGPSLYPPRP